MSFLVLANVCMNQFTLFKTVVHSKYFKFILTFIDYMCVYEGGDKGQVHGNFASE